MSIDADKITDELVRAAATILMQHGLNAPEQVIHTAARAAITDAFARAIVSLQAPPDAVTRAARHLVETVERKSWDGLRADGRAKDGGFEPFHWGAYSHSVNSGARQEDYRDVVREIGVILGAVPADHIADAGKMVPTDHIGDANKMVAKSHAALRLALPLLECTRNRLANNFRIEEAEKYDTVIAAIRDVIGDVIGEDGK
jgi:hypothetical protein